jgi:hypothetical protein
MSGTGANGGKLIDGLCACGSAECVQALDQDFGGFSGVKSQARLKASAVR